MSLNPRCCSKRISVLCVVVLLVFSLLMAGCTELSVAGLGNLGAGKEPEQDDHPGSVQEVSDHGPGGEEDCDLLHSKPNELGKIMIIMYHDVQEKEGEWVRSRDNFCQDLQRFYDLGYTLIPFNSYLKGEIDVPAGRAPLVFTFDDGTSGQFKMIQENGQKVVDPDCAVGMLLAFSEEHPDFGHAATFYINFPAPFRAADSVAENLDFLVQNGMEIGNHTYNHEDLASASPTKVAEEIGSLANKVREISGYEMLSLALPYGGYPKSKENLGSGHWEGQEYVNLGVLLVGAEAAPSPFSKQFNPMAIPRIRGSQVELDKWLGYFQKYPERRYQSDGDPNTVTILENDLEDLAPDKVEDMGIRTYSLDGKDEG